MANIRIRTRHSTTSHLVRPRPQGDGPFELWFGDKFSAYVHADVLDFIKTQAALAQPNETIGLLAGRVCNDPINGPYTLVMAAENAREGEFESDEGSVRLLAIGQIHLRRRLEGAHPDREIIGWYHTHPGYPSVFSGVDTQEQATWSDPNHIGIVYSTNDKTESFGVYRGPDSIRLQAAPNSRPKATHKIESLPYKQAATTFLTPRPEPLDTKRNVLTINPAARFTKVQIAILIIIAAICVTQAYSVFKLDRRLAFTEGRLHQLSASQVTPERSKEPAPAQLSATPVTTSATQTDGPELRVPVKPLSPETTTRQQTSERRSSARVQERKVETPNKRKQSSAKKSEADKTEVKSKSPTSPAAAESKPDKDPKPKATPK